MKRPANRRILGLDPGYGRLGFGVIDVAGHEAVAVTYGVITTPPNTESAGRLMEIAKDVRSIIAAHKPDLVVIEEIFFVQSTTTALKVAEVRGVLLLLAAENDLPIIEVKPMEVKLALTGYGKADKHQMQEMVKTVFKLKAIPKPDDAADALAIAWAGSSKTLAGIH